MITNIRWNNRQLSPHRTLTKFETAVEVTSRSASPDFSKLRPGESEKHLPPSVKERATDNDRITFTNGYTVEERSSDSGSDESGALYFRSPEGETEILDRGYHFIHADRETDYQPAVYSRNLPDQDVTWQQSFPEEGGMKLRVVDEDRGVSMSYPDFTISPQGELSSSAYSSLTGGEKVEARLEGKALVMQAGDTQFAVVPPVPAEWFLSQNG